MYTQRPLRGGCVRDGDGCVALPEASSNRAGKWESCPTWWQRAVDPWNGSGGAIRARWTKRANVQLRDFNAQYPADDCDLDSGDDV